MKPFVRDERHSDVADIFGLIRAAFGHDDEANLVDQLRDADALAVSLVLVDDGQLIAHASASPMAWVSGSTQLATWALAPVSVVPEAQGRGFGTQIVWATIDRCRQLGADILTVLGSPAYYSRFGFTAASQHGLGIDGADFGDVFMVLDLAEGSLADVHGLLRWHPAFDKLGED